MMADDTTNARANPKTPTPNPTLVRLAALVGAWQTEAAAGGKSMGRGRTVFAWLEGGAFLGYHADVEQSSFDDGTTIRGRWEKSADGAQWDHDFDLIYTKVG